MAQPTNQERLAVLETKVDTALVKLDALDTKIDKLLPTVITEERYTQDLIGLRAEIKAVDRRRWVQNTLSAILGAILAILIQGYFG